MEWICSGLFQSIEQVHADRSSYEIQKEILLVLNSFEVRLVTQYILLNMDPGFIYLFIHDLSQVYLSLSLEKISILTR